MIWSIIRKLINLGCLVSLLPLPLLTLAVCCFIFILDSSAPLCFACTYACPYVVVFSICVYYICVRLLLRAMAMPRLSAFWSMSAMLVIVRFFVLCLYLDHPLLYFLSASLSFVYSFVLCLCLRCLLLDLHLLCLCLCLCLSCPLFRLHLSCFLCLCYPLFCLLHMF